MEQKQQKTDGVFEGGGVTGIALVGAVSVIENAGYEFVNLAGTSSGAIVATLLAAKYTAAEVKDIINSFNFQSFEDARWIGKIPLIGPLISLLAWKGLYKGDVFYTLMRDLLAKKGIHTFGDLRRPQQELDAIDESEREKYTYRVRVVATDISQKTMLVLPQDIAGYGLQPDGLEVAKAVRMSMGFPFFFEPVKLGNSDIVDGGVVSNFPIELFDSITTPKWPTFGFKLVMSDQMNPSQLIQQPIQGPLAEFAAIFQTAMGAHDAYYLSKDKFVRTVAIDNLNIGAIDFQLTPTQKEALYQSGVKAATDFLTHWDFETYKKYYRSNIPLPGRHEIVLHPTSFSSP
jgi:NTE family protein